MTRYSTQWGADTITVEADFSQASCQVKGTNGRQVADFQHRPTQALRYAVEAEARAEGLDIYDDDTIQGIEAAVDEMVEA